MRRCCVIRDEVRGDVECVMRSEVCEVIRDVMWCNSKGMMGSVLSMIIVLLH